MLSHGAIAGIVISVLVIVSLAIALPILLRKKENKNAKNSTSRNFLEVWWYPGVGDDAAIYSNTFRWNLSGLTCDVANVVLMAPCVGSNTATNCTTACENYQGMSTLSQYTVFEKAFKPVSKEIRIWLRFQYDTGKSVKPSPPTYVEQYESFNNCFGNKIPKLYGLMYEKEQVGNEGTPSDNVDLNSFWGLVTYLNLKAATIGAPTIMAKNLLLPYTAGIGEFYEPYILPTCCCPETDQECTTSDIKTCATNVYTNAINIASPYNASDWKKETTEGYIGVLAIGSKQKGNGVDCGMDETTLPEFVKGLDSEVQRLALYL